MATARVEWTILGGELAESVLAVLVYSDIPKALRVRPSQGDGGIDILVAAQADRTNVYQVKKFATNLTGSQKGQIDRSFWRLLGSLGAGKLDLGDWTLLMPLDPTPENSVWFGDLPKRAVAHFENVLADPAKFPKEPMTRAGLDAIESWIASPETSIEWLGLIACEAMAARNPQVIDYYLHGGRDRVESAVAQVAALLRTDQNLPHSDGTGDVTPAGLREHLVRLQTALDTDPHFRYGVSLDPARPTLLAEESLIAAAQETAADGSCLTFRIYARFAEALNERPVPIKLQFVFEPGTPEFEQFELWRKYGKPVELPASVELDLPGGLGGTHEAGRVSISQPADHQTYQLRYRISRPDGSNSPTITLTMEPATSGVDGGVWTRGRDSTGILEIETLYDLTAETGRIHLALDDPTGKVAAEAATAYEFLAAWEPGNRLEIAGPQGAFRPFITLPDDADRPVEPAAVRLLMALAAIQTRVYDTIAVPDLSEVTAPQLRAIEEAGELCDGKTLVRHWKSAPFYPMDGTTPTMGVDLECRITDNFVVTIATRRYTLGVCVLNLLSAQVHQSDAGYILLPATNDTAIRSLNTDPAERHVGPPHVQVRPANARA